MKQLNLALKLFKNNFSLYFSYWIVIVIAICCYYNFASLMFNEQILKVSNIVFYVKVGSIICSFVLSVTILMYIWNANKFFFKRRQNEIGLYLLMGISKLRILSLVAMESLYLLGTALIIGLPLGIISSGVFVKGFSYIMNIDTKIEFSVPIGGIKGTMVYFLIIFVALMINNGWLIHKSDLIDFFQARKKSPQINRFKYLKALIGTCMLLGAYYLASHLWELQIDIIMLMPLITMIVCIGMFLFFSSTLSIILEVILSNKTFLYKKMRIMSYNTIRFRLFDDARYLANTAILMSALLTSLMMVISLYTYVDEDIVIKNPYHISFADENNDIDSEVTSVIENSGHELLDQQVVPFIEMEDEIIVEYGIYKSQLMRRANEDLESIVESTKPDKNLVSAIVPAGLMGSNVSSVGSTVQLLNHTLVIEKEVRIPFMGDLSPYNRKQIIIVGSDIYNELLKSEKEIYLHGFNITKPEDSGNLVTELIELKSDTPINAYIISYNSRFYVVGIFCFLGGIMSIIFAVAMFSSMYFKVLFDGLDDREQYKKLMNIGADKWEINQAIRRQSLITIMIPALISCVNSIFAILPISKMLYSDFTYSMTIASMLFAVAVIITNEIIVRKYTKLIDVRTI